MSEFQFMSAVFILVLGVAAAGLFSWGISGVFAPARRKADAAAGGEDYAAKLTRRNLAMKQAHRGR